MLEYFNSINIRCWFDPTQTDVNTIDGVTLARTVSFYDNEYGFTSNMIRTLLYFAEISE